MNEQQKNELQEKTCHDIGSIAGWVRFGGIVLILAIIAVGVNTCSRLLLY